MLKNKLKFKTLFELLKSSSLFYKDLDEFQKSYLATVVGAAIFYLPSGKKTFSGYISEEAIKVEKNKRVKEHSFPRKIAGKLLLENPPKSIEELEELYYTKYGQWNLVTKKENNDLRKFQKINNFISPEDSYQKANIKLCLVIQP